MTALTATPAHADSPWSARRPASGRSRHLVSVPTGEEVGTRAPGRVHITRRGRLAVTTTTLLAASVVGASMAVGGTADPQQVTVERGQTLSEVAEAEMTGLPTKEAVSRLRMANGLSSGHVHAGQQLVVPQS